MVERIEDYGDVLKVFLKPTRKYPLGTYFYADAEDIDLVKSYNWFINGGLIKAQPYEMIYFSKELLNADKVLHRNHITFDNVKTNLVAGNTQKLNYDKMSKGYNQT